MFYCNPCGECHGWPTGTLMRSRGRCELCDSTAICNDVPSSLLPLPVGAQPVKLDDSRDRYYVTTDSRGEREVDKAGYVAVERQAGFRSKFGPNEVATGSFGNGALSGRIEYNQSGG